MAEAVHARVLTQNVRTALHQEGEIIDTALTYIAIFLIPAVLACIPAYVAWAKGRKFSRWFIYGYFLFLPAVIHAALIQADEMTVRMARESQYSRARPLVQGSAPILAIAILIALVLAEGALLVRSESDEGPRAEVLQTSQRFVVALTTYNSTTLESQRAAVLALAAGRFRKEYTDLTGADFLAALRERQADSKGRVVHIAVTSVEGADAEALALIEVTTTNKDLTTPRVEQNLIELSLVRSGGGWRVDAVSILGTLS